MTYYQTITETHRARMREAVIFGASWLDELRPGWRDSVPPDEIQMCSPTFCIAGWVFAADAALTGEQSCGYDYACEVALRDDVRALASPGHSATVALYLSAVRGLTISDLYPGAEQAEAWAALGDAWRAELAAVPA